MQALQDQFMCKHLWLNLSINYWYYVIPNGPLNHNLDKKRLQKHHRTFRRDREPSRISIRTLQRLSNKSREVRKFVYKCMCSSTPPSSKMHCFFKVRKHKLKLKSSEPLRKSILKLKSQTKRYCSLFFVTELCVFRRVKPMQWITVNWNL